MNRKLLRFLLAPALVLVAGLPAVAQQPPTDLHLVGDHWTAWDPPSEIPEGATVHIIEPGDTLWDLAQHFYGDPYLWPQLWEGNQYILDAHWIYPGDPLLVDRELTVVEGLETIDLEEGAPGEGEGEPGEGEAAERLVETADEAASSPTPLGSESDIYCSGYVGDLQESFPYQIVGSEAEAQAPNVGVGRGTAGQGRWGSLDTTRYGMMTGDIVYTDGGRLGGLSPGQVLTVVERQSRVVHPVTGEVFGRLYHYTGRIRILSVQEETAIAEIVQACDPVVVGSSLKLFAAEPVPLARRSVPRPPNLPSPAESLAGAPIILSARDDVVALGQDNVVFIDRGYEQEVSPGDIFTIYRLHPKGLPPVIVGELAVLSVHPRSAVARIIESRYTVYVGDRLELK